MNGAVHRCVLPRLPGHRGKCPDEDRSNPQIIGKILAPNASDRNSGPSTVIDSCCGPWPAQLEGFESKLLANLVWSDTGSAQTSEGARIIAFRQLLSGLIA